MTPYKDDKFNVEKFLPEDSVTILQARCMDRDRMIDDLRTQFAECESEKSVIESTMLTMSERLAECERERDMWRDNVAANGLRVAEVQSRLDRLIEGILSVLNNTINWELLSQDASGQLRALVYEVREKSPASGLLRDVEARAYEIGKFQYKLDRLVEGMEELKADIDAEETKDWGGGIKGKWLSATYITKRLDNLIRTVKGD